MHHSSVVHLSLALALITLGACNPGGEGDGSETESTAGPTTAATTAGTTATTGTSANTTEDDESESGGQAACGDGVIDPGEVCDGSALAEMTCADVMPGSVGPLACAGDCTSFDTSACTTPSGAARVVFNEVTAKGATMGPYADLGDAIELINVGDQAADLSGWRLADDMTLPVDGTYVFPPGVSLAPGGYLVLVRLDEEAGVGDFPFGITTVGEETLTLVDAEGKLVDQRVLQGEDALESYCGLPDGTGTWDRCDQTLGAMNLALSKICGNNTVEKDEPCDGADLGGSACTDLGFDEGTLACTPACTLDTSMCASASAIALNELEAVDDRIELYNSGADMIDITGWILTDKYFGGDYDPAADLEKLVFPGVTSLAGKAFMVIAKGDKIGEHAFGLSTQGDVVTLLKPDLTPVSQVSYGDGQAATSYCRMPDGKSGNWSAGCMPTFGAKNIGP